MKYHKLIWLILFVLIGCARTYHVYNFACDGSTIKQTIEVKADVPKQIETNADTDVSVIP